MTRARRAAQAPRPRRRSPEAARRRGQGPRGRPRAPRSVPAGSARRRSRPSARSAPGRPGRRTIGCVGAPPSRDCRNGVRSRGGQGAHAGPMLVPPAVLELRCAWRAGGSRCVSAAGGCCGASDPTRWCCPACRAWAPIAYAGPARELVGALKFRGATGVAETMAAQIAANAPEADAARARARAGPARTRAGCGGAATTRRRLIADALAQQGRPRGRRLPRARRVGRAPQVGRDRRRTTPRPGRQHRAARGRARARRTRRRRGHHRRHARPPAPGALRDAGSIEVAALVFARTIGR